MIADLQDEASKCGLKVHMGKTAVLTNATGRPRSIQCAGSQVRVLQKGESEKYLGRKLSLDDFHGVELRNRIACGWSTFRGLKAVLCDRRILLRNRLRLLQSCVAPSMLYAAGSWTLTLDQERKIRTAQRQMLRRMLMTPRETDETWVAYIQRATHIAINLAERHGVKDWVVSFHEQKGKLRNKLLTTNDGRWSPRLFGWRPWHRVIANRAVGSPRKRWSDR